MAAIELRVIGRGALAGFITGIVSFIFAKIFAEPVINKAIAYESGRDYWLQHLNKAAGRPVPPDGPEIFSRTIQSTVGIATGLIGFSTAIGALVSVAYLFVHGRFNVRPRTLALLVALFGFLGVYGLPYVKYPANPPAIGHTFTIATRSALYITTVVSSLAILSLAVVLGRRLQRRSGTFYATLLAGAAALVVFSVLIGLLPSLGNLSANVGHQHQFGYARSSTETPQPITNLRGKIVYPGFPADVLWKFRFYSLLNQLLIWTGIGLIFSALLERIIGDAPSLTVEQVLDPSGVTRTA